MACELRWGECDEGSRIEAENKMPIRRKQRANYSFGETSTETWTRRNHGQNRLDGAACAARGSTQNPVLRLVAAKHRMVLVLGQIEEQRRLGQCRPQLVGEGPYRNRAI